MALLSTETRSTPRKAKVLIVDDSALVRQLLTRILGADPSIEVVGAAADPLIATEKIKQLDPDVITLDVEMPRMDGLDFLDRLMRLRPTPVLMVSSLTHKGADAMIRALELGAIDFVAKPKFDIADGLERLRDELCSKVKAARGANVSRRISASSAPATPAKRTGFRTTEAIVAIGASTGGVEALTHVLRSMPADGPAVLVTQHMPEGFTKSFAARLNGLCAMTVAEASDGARVLPGHVYIAPGSRHLRLSRSGANYVCAVKGSERVSGHCPSVDVLFQSVAECAGSNAIGAIFTGMGRDGAEGLLKMRKAGATTFGQDEATCVVYGMPRAAFEIGAVEIQVSIERMAASLLHACGQGSGRAIRV